jgi:hypothetical protein
MLIFSFGSGFQLENASPEYMASIKSSVDYANAHGIEVGGYEQMPLGLLSRAGVLIVFSTVYTRFICG